MGKRMTNDLKRITKNDIIFHLISFKLTLRNKQCKRKKNERCTYVFLNLGPKKHLKNLKKRKQNVNKKGSSTEFLKALLKLKPKIPNFLVKRKRAILKSELIQSIFFVKTSSVARGDKMKDNFKFLFSNRPKSK